MHERIVLGWLAALVFSWATALPALAANPVMRNSQIDAIVAGISAQRIAARHLPLHVDGRSMSASCTWAKPTAGMARYCTACSEPAAANFRAPSI